MPYGRPGATNPQGALALVRLLQSEVARKVMLEGGLDPVSQ